MPPEAPRNWPATLTYLATPTHSPHLTSAQLAYLHAPPASSTAALPKVSLPFSAAHIAILPISSPLHPACSQSGLFAVRELAPDELVAVYLGLVHGDSDADMQTAKASDYDISLDRERGLAIDAASMGSEARFVNDYRGVPRGSSSQIDRHGHDKVNSKSIASVKGPNAEFRDVWVEYAGSDGRVLGERAMGIYVLGAGKSGKKKGGVKAGEEILVSYGKGFWEERRKEHEVDA